MSFRRQIVLWSALIASASWGEVRAQYADLHWRHIGTAHGLPVPLVQALCEDPSGYLWVGTGKGLARFDGSTFQVFKHMESDSLSLIHDYIANLSVVEDGRLFIGTMGGFSLLNLKDGRFENHRLELKSDYPDFINVIRGICEWPDGKAWLATGAGTVEWDRAAQSFALLDTALWVSRSGANNPIIRDSGGAGCWLMLLGTIGYFDYRSQKLTVVNSNFYPPDPNRILESMARDASGVLWYTSLTDSALYSYDPATGLETREKFYRIANGQREPVSVVYMAFDTEGKLWITSWNDNYRIFDPHARTWQKLESLNNDPSRLPFGNCNALYHSPRGEVIAGHNEGFSIHAPHMEAAQAIAVPASGGAESSPWFGIAALAQDPLSETVFVGCYQIGLIRYPKGSRAFDVLPIRPGDDLTNSILSLLWVEGKLWCGTSKGLYIFDPETDSFALFDPGGNGQFAKIAISLLVRTGDLLWFDGNAGSLYRFDIRTGTVRELKHRPEDAQSLFPNRIAEMLADRKGRLWLAHHNGYARMDPGDEVFHHTVLYKEDLPFGGNICHALIEGADGRIWLTTRADGNYIIDPETCQPTAWQHPDVPVDEFTPVAATFGHWVWFGSHSGMKVLDTRTNRLAPFAHDLKVFNTLLFHKSMMLKNGKMLLHKNQCLLLIDPAFVDVRYTVAPPVISAVEAADSVFAFFGNPLHLSHKHNDLVFRFSSLSDLPRDDISYSYRLSGYDPDWIEARQTTSATYRNLAGGDYTFMVRARSGEGEWTDSKWPVTVSVEKRYYETLRFRVFIFLGLLLLLVFIIGWQRRIERKVNRERALRHFTTSKPTESTADIAADVARIALRDLGMSAAAVYFPGDVPGVFQLVTALPPTATFPANTSAVLGSTEVLPVEGFPIGTECIALRHDRRLQGLVMTIPKRPSKAAEDKRVLNEIATVCGGRLAAAHADREVKQKEELLARVNALLSESQLSSLRAQMNPHFVFNCLNSIQESIIMKQYAEAGLYLNKFAKLFRLVLSNSSKSLIPLSEEIHILTLYLELEHMRFQRSFTFEIVCDEELDRDEILIPSMLLQPFVENALWHGLMHKADNRALSVRFYPLNDEVFVCEIRDNGIGRARAAEIKKSKTAPTTHESKGIEISLDRLRLIGLQQSKHATASIEDLYGPKGIPEGTLVRFEISSYLS